ncbi:unnamed protein product [Spirodela intermedia]|uniref:Uncharacterized protein n=1 Tax=Spirodela intermedia TaxID=51605 RepID=A0A7I8K938_SPIIN|nr:unnamed protein product [Spirodela intermedia]
MASLRRRWPVRRPTPCGTPAANVGFGRLRSPPQMRTLEAAAR